MSTATISPAAGAIVWVPVNDPSGQVVHDYGKVIQWGNGSGTIKVRTVRHGVHDVEAWQITVLTSTELAQIRESNPFYATKLHGL